MELSAPIHVHWEITNACNLSCLHCYQQDDRRHTQLSRNDLFHIAEKLVRGRVFQITLTGGEPFLVDSLQDLVRYFNDSGIIPQVSSNGTVITSSVASWLAGVQVAVQISLDSHKPEIHDYIRQYNGAFELTLKAVDRLQDRGVPVSLAFCANRKNYKDIEQVIELAISRGVKVLAIGEIIPIYGASSRSLSFTQVEYKQFVENVVDLQQRYSSRIDIQFISEWGFLYSHVVEHWPCTAMDRDMAILFDGTVSPCPFIRHEAYSIGNILDTSLRQVWRSDAADDFRSKKHLGCDSKCLHYDICMGGCKAALANKGLPITERSPLCPLKRAETQTLGG